MSVSEADIAFAMELFDDLPGLSSRKMMGGLCLYSEGVIFVLLYSDGQIYLKAKGDFIAEMEALGAEQWSYQREGKKQVGMPYWTLPSECLDDREEATRLARAALRSLEE